MSNPYKKDYIRKAILIILVTIMILVPLWILVINSFKNRGESMNAGFMLPTVWQIKENYTEVYIKGNTVRGFLNSLIFLVTVIPSLIFISSLASWIFARAKTKLIRTLYYIVISGILIPPAIVCSIKVLKILNIYGTRLGLYIFYVGTMMSFALFFTTGFIKSIPIELEEAARIDGCNNFQVFFRIIFPLMKPVSATISIFIGIIIWNDFLWPFYMLRSTKQYTLVLGLYNFVSSAEHSINWHLVFADVVMVSLPFVLLYLFAQKYIISGIMSGAIKQ